MSDDQHQYPHVARFEWTGPDGETEEILYPHDFDPEDWDADYENRQRREQQHGIITITWSWEDIITRFIENSEEKPVVLPNSDDLRWMLQRLLKWHDCNYGMTWDSIDAVIDEWKSQQEEKTNA